MLLVIAAPAICLGGSPTANVLGRVEEFVKAGAAKDQQAFHELSMVCESRAAPFESKVRRAAEKLAGIDANIREMEAVARRTNTTELSASIAALKGETGRLQQQLDSMDALHKTTSDMWNAHQEELEASVQLLSPYMHEYQSLATQELKESGVGVVPEIDPPVRGHPSVALLELEEGLAKRRAALIHQEDGSPSKRLRRTSHAGPLGALVRRCRSATCARAPPLQ